MRNYGRWVYHRSPDRKLSDDQARHVKWLLYYGVPCPAIAKRYGMSVTGIYSIRDNHTYKDIER